MGTLPHAKWQSAGKQVILKSDFIDIESAITSQTQVRLQPQYQWVDVATLKVAATADSPAAMMLDGFPNVLNPNVQVDGAGLTDHHEVVNVSNVSMLMASGGIYGNEKSSQLYALFAIAAAGVTTFSLKSMPFMLVKSQASQVISLGTIPDASVGIGYGFTSNQLQNSLLYVLSGASKGLLRTISANNTDNSNAGTITYSGTALTLAQGDLFIVFPPGTNFRYLGCFFNNSSGDIINTNPGPNNADFVTAGTFYWVIIAPIASASVYGAGGGGGGGGGDGVNNGGDGHGFTPYLYRPNIAPGALLKIVVGAGGPAGNYNNNGSPGYDSKFNADVVGAAGLGGAKGGVGGGYTIPATILGPNYGYGGLGGDAPSHGGSPGYSGCLFLWWW